MRGQPFAEHGGIAGAGYHLTGPAACIAGGRELRVADRLAILLELRGTLYRVAVPVAGGDATLTNVALHALAGIAMRL